MIGGMQHPQKIVIPGRYNHPLDLPE